MIDGTTSGRGFEHPFTLYIFGAIAIISALLWLWFHLEIRKAERQRRSEKADD